MNLKTTDKAIFAFIEQEQERQEEQINLIASENYTPLAVLQATASVLTNKYAEGYPGKRYYAGCNLVDQVEQLAINRCKHLFGADHANVQPHAGSQANMAVYTAILKPGDTIMGMSLSAGGHLTHGHTVNFSGIYYKSIQYGVDPDTEQLNYDTIASLAEQHKPKLIVVGASAYSRIINFEHIAQIATNVGAYLLADIAHIAGLIATGLHPSPIPYADFVSSTTHKTLRGPRGGLVMSKKEYASHIDRAIMPGTQGGPFMHSIAAKAVAFHLACQPTFKAYQQQVINNAKKMAQLFTHLGYRIVAGGTDNHLFIVDLRSKNITGRAAEIALEQAGITVSRSCIPFDPAKPWITSGIRLGTPAIATRGMKEQETEQIVYFIDEVIKYHNNQLQLQRIKQQVKKLCMQFPIYNQNALHNPLSFMRMFENSSL
ncbi:MAG: serine hydroxymethyltransferase [Candidatus Babeliales bacterium]